MRRLALVVVVGCYRPQDQPCVIECAHDTDCPGELTCTAQRCTLGGMSCTTSDATTSDANGPQADADVTHDDAGNPCIIGGLGTVCGPFAGPRVLAGVLDTTTGGSFCDPPDTSPWCTVSGTTISFPDGNLAVLVIGPRPLVLAALESITIGADIDASSSFARGGNGPGANGFDCGALPGADGVGVSGKVGGGGGGGGSYLTHGGAGGMADNTAQVGVAGTTLVTPLALIGGCGGAHGGVAVDGAAPGKGGASGGAIYFLSAGSIVIDALISASGQGGSGALGTTSGAGGGGGGSGGLIALESQTLTFGNKGRLVALCGGGGGGGGNLDGGGGAGADPVLNQPGMGGGPGLGGASGGNGAPNTGTSGAANGGSTANGASVGSGGGGGGGGGCGIIGLRITAPILGTLPVFPTRTTQF